jgi:ABC-type multidrug transport system fused ATPase/permease subunit
LLQVLGNFITFGAAVFVIIEADTIDPSQVGLIITYALSVTQVLNWLVRMTADVETNIVAVERIKVIIFVISRGCIKKK